LILAAGNGDDNGRGIYGYASTTQTQNREFSKKSQVLGLLIGKY
jgi:hypothetical protein